MTSKKTTGPRRPTSGPAPRPPAGYGPQPTKQTAVHTGARIIREAPVTPPPVRRPDPALEQQRRARPADEIDGGEERNEEGGAGAPRRIRARPNDALAKRRAERKKRGVVDHGFDKRLSLDESKLDTDNYAYYWATSDMVQRLEAREYEVVASDDVKGQEVARHAGNDRNAKPQQQVLMRKYKPWDEEDRQERLKLNREQDEALLRGNSKAIKAEGQGGADYTPENNSMEFEERTH